MFCCLNQLKMAKGGHLRSVHRRIAMDAGAHNKTLGKLLTAVSSRHHIYLWHHMKISRRLLVLQLVPNT